MFVAVSSIHLPRVLVDENRIWELPASLPGTLPLCCPADRVYTEPPDTADEVSPSLPGRWRPGWATHCHCRPKNCKKDLIRFGPLRNVIPISFFTNIREVTICIPPSSRNLVAIFSLSGLSWLPDWPSGWSGGGSWGGVTERCSNKRRRPFMAKQVY